MNIGWIQIEKTSSQQKFGGSLYNELARSALKSKYTLHIHKVNTKNTTKPPSFLDVPFILLNLSRLKGSEDIWIRDYFSTVTLPLDKTKGKNIVLMQHIDSTSLPFFLKFLSHMYRTIFYHNLKKVNAIVTISKYWANHFRDRGYKNIYTIYPPIMVDETQITNSKVHAFKKKYHLLNKPIIYIGNCRRYKGVVEAYDALKDLDVHIVTSGHKEVDLPTPNLDLNYEEYLLLLKASTIVVTMSTFKEGWNITAHEAMYLGTPVIGSGRGGMGELLTGGEQIICSQFSNLKKYVEDLLPNEKRRKIMGAKGHTYAKQFTLKKFNHDWISVIEETAHQ